MAKICTVCKHPERPRIEAALRRGLPLREVARQFGLGKDPLARHRRHLPGVGDDATAPASQGTAESDNLTMASFSRIWKSLSEGQESTTPVLPPNPGPRRRPRPRVP